MRISDWSSDVCSSDLAQAGAQTTLCARTVSELEAAAAAIRRAGGNVDILELDVLDVEAVRSAFSARPSYDILVNNAGTNRPMPFLDVEPDRSEEHTSELQSLMRISYAVFCLKKKKPKTIIS